MAIGGSDNTRNRAGRDASTPPTGWRPLARRCALAVCFGVFGHAGLSANDRQPADIARGPVADAVTSASPAQPAPATELGAVAPAPPAATPAVAPASTPDKADASKGDASESDTSKSAFQAFLDKLMRAESGGRDNARNPRSTALGPFQFIESTFLDVTRRHFADEIVGLTDIEILALRTDRPFARRAAEAFSRDNVAALKAEGIPASEANLRLAFLLGSTAAIRVLQAPPESPLASLVSTGVVYANPFMAGMTSGDLVARAAQDVEISPARALRLASLSASSTQSSEATDAVRHRIHALGKATSMRRAPAINVLCNRALPSCRRWVALQTSIMTARAATGRRRIFTAQR